MFPIRWVHDDIPITNKEAITQVRDILRTQILTAYQKMT